MAKDYTLQDLDDKLDELQNLEYISDHNFSVIEDMTGRLKADPDVSNNRIYKYLYTYKTLFKKFIDFKLDEPSKEEMRKAVGNIEASDYSQWTKQDWRKIIKRTLRTLYDDETERPKEITQILNARFMKGYKSIERKHEIEPLKPQEVLDMSDSANHPRNMLMPVFYFESGARISEILGVTISDVQLYPDYAEVKFKSMKNDKGPRELVLTKSVDLLRKWLEIHPRRDEPEAPLFVNIGSGKGSHVGEQLTQSNSLKIHRKLAERVGIEKRITNHLYRHSSATFYGMYYSVARMMYKYSWKELETAKTYVHENSERMKKQTLVEEGIEEDEKEESFSRQICAECGESWCPTTKYCGKCSKELEQQNEDSGDMTNKELLQRINELESKVAE